MLYQALIKALWAGFIAVMVQWPVISVGLFFLGEQSPFRLRYIGWAIKAEGNKRPTRVTKKFDDAFIIALGFSAERNAGVEIHDTNGRLNPDSSLYSLTVSENGGNQKVYDYIPIPVDKP